MYLLMINKVNNLILVLQNNSSPRSWVNPTDGKILCFTVYSN